VGGAGVFVAEGSEIVGVTGLLVELATMAWLLVADIGGWLEGTGESWLAEQADRMKVTKRINTRAFLIPSPHTQTQERHSTLFF
jgi:hypothetical protein